MKQSLKEKRALEKAAALFGLDVKSMVEETQEQSRHAEATLTFLRTPEKFGVARDCKQCGDRFLTNMACVSYCSDACRKTALYAIGIEWSNTKTQEDRWGSSGIPLVVPAEVLALLRAKLLETFDADGTFQPA